MRPLLAQSSLTRGMVCYERKADMLSPYIKQKLANIVSLKVKDTQVLSIVDCSIYN
jgi:hypothetical protein